MHRVAPRSRIDLAAEPMFAACRSGASLLLLRCGAGSTLSVPAGVAALCWPLRGQVVALSADSRSAFDRRSLLVSDSQRTLDICCQTAADAVVLIATQAWWSALDGAQAPAGPALFPALHRARALVCRHLLDFLRTASANPDEPITPAGVGALTTAVAEMQRPFATLIERCPGRSLRRQHAVFMRLQRVRNYLSACTLPDLDVKRLARSANYSVWRFIRVYYSVFGETPYAHISRCRVDRARALLELSEQCVSDIALAVGFENRATLTRAIKRRYGLSAVQLRGARERTCATN